MDRESAGKKLVRVRPPHVQVVYDLEVGKAIESTIDPDPGGLIRPLRPQDSSESQSKDKAE